MPAGSWQLRVRRSSLMDSVSKRVWLHPGSSCFLFASALNSSSRNFQDFFDKRPGSYINGPWPINSSYPCNPSKLPCWDIIEMSSHLTHTEMNILPYRYFYLLDPLSMLITLFDTQTAKRSTRRYSFDSRLVYQTQYFPSLPHSSLHGTYPSSRGLSLILPLPDSQIQNSKHIQT